MYAYLRANHKQNYNTMMFVYIMAIVMIMITVMITMNYANDNDKNGKNYPVQKSHDRVTIRIIYINFISFNE